MAEEVEPREQVPPPGEAVHLPGPSYLPVVTAAGISLAVVGVVIFPVAAIVGLVITVFAVFRWIRESREEISELPLEH